MKRFKKALFKSIGFLFSIFIISLFFSSSLYSQLQTDYPFYAVSDATGKIYVTGNVYNSVTSTEDIFISIIEGLNITTYIYPKSDGHDKAYSLAIDANNDIYITGYVYNNNTSSNDIIILKHILGSGQLTQFALIESPYDDAGLSVTIVNGVNIAICGYKTFLGSTEKDFYVAYYYDGTIAWDFEKDYSPEKLDDVATSIVADNNYLYVGGYADQDGVNNNDIVLVDFDINEGATPHQEIIQNTNSDEKLTSYIITDLSPSSLVKSKRVFVGELDHHLIPAPGDQDYWITRITSDEVNSRIQWQDGWNNSERDIPTAITSDNDYVYITGYTYTTNGGYDFATLQYTKDDEGSGHLIWSHVWDNNGGEDQPSSIRINGRGYLCVTGSSSEATNDYTILVYDGSESNSSPGEPTDTVRRNILWKKNYSPEIAGFNLRDFKKYTYCSTDSIGNITMMTFGYNDSVSFYSGQMYNAEGKVLSTIQPKISKKIKKKKTPNIGNSIISNNFPNPFNPVTSIQFSISNPDFVQLSIYDITGRKLETLVNEKLTAGQYNVKWDATKYSSGIYFYTITAGNQNITRKLTLIK